MIGTTLTAAQVWRVVIIEDSPDDLIEVRRLLLKGSDRRFQFVEAETGAAGVRAVLDAADGPPDCVVLDYTLPDMDALEVLAAVVGPDGLTICPVVVLTGVAGPQQGPVVLRAGAQDFIGKGWMTAESLTRAVENAVERWAMTRELHARTMALQDSEAQLQLAVSVAGLGVIRIDYAKDTVVLDTIAAGLFGLEAARPLPRSAIHATFHPDDKDEIFRLMNQSLDPTVDGCFVMEHRVIHQDGSIHWLNVKKQVVFGEIGGVRCPLTSVLAAVDITERKVAEAELWDRTEQLAEAEARIRSVVNNVIYGIITIDERGVVETFNSAAEQLFGYNAEEVVGQNVKMLMGEPHNLEHDGYLANYKRTGQAKIIGIGREVEGRRKDGSKFLMDLGISEFMRGERGCFTGVVRDITERKQAEQSLRESEERFRATFASTPVGIAHVALDGRWLRFNDAICTVTGYEREKLATLTFAEITHPDDVKADWALSRRLLAGEIAVYSIEKRYLREDGDTVWVNLTVSLLRDANGAPVNFISVVEDITARIASEAALRSSEIRYRRLFESAKDGILILDGQTGQITDANPYILQVLGGTSAEVLGRELWEIGVFSDATASRAAMVELQDRGYVRYEDLPLESKTGQRREVEVVANVYQENGQRVSQCNIRDITERKQAQKALLASEERVRMATEATEVGVWEWNVHTKAIRWDAQMFRIYGIAPTQDGFVDYSDLSGAMLPEEVLENERIAKDTMRRSGQSRREFRIHRRDDGERRNIEAVETVRMNEKGEPEWVLGTNLDVTDRKTAENRLRQLAAELSEADRRKDEFLATLAHELRNPLAPIRNGLQVIKLAGVTGTVEQARIMMERQLTQMVRLVDDLLDVSRISLGKIELRTERVEMRKVIDVAVETGRPMIDEAEHDLVVAIPDEPIFVDGDATRLAQVVSNLLTNSAKYMHRGGRIRLTVRRDGEAVAVSVADDGIGIPPTMLDKVFVMFTQVDRTLEKTTGGLGIGLSLVKGLVQMHGGTIEAKSEGEGKGSEFVVRLPAVVAPMKPQELEMEEKKPVKSSRRILVVDDNRDGANTLTMMLKILGNDTRTAYDGQAGVDLAEQFRPDVILLDIGLPKLNGHEACRRIREQPWGTGILMIAVTGWGQDEDRRRSQEAGFDHHLVKPVDPQALMKMLAGLQVATT